MTADRVLNRFRPTPADQKIAFIAHALLLTILMGLTSGLVRAQSSSAEQQTPAPSLATAPEAPADNQFVPIQHQPVHRSETAPCRLQVPDPVRRPAKEGADVAQTSASAVYTPLSVHCKLEIFLKSTYSPYTFASAAFGATEAQATGQWPHYGGGVQGWGKRLGATLANTESRRFIQGFALSTILHQDPRYFPSPKRRLFSRAWYSATRVVITKNDKGDSAFNSSEFLGALLTSALQNSYYPRHDRTFGDTMTRFSGALSSDAVGDLLREFTPDMKRLFRKHAPKKILQIEEKLPIPAEDKP